MYAIVRQCCLEDAAALVSLLLSLWSGMLNAEDSQAVRLVVAKWIWPFLLGRCVPI